MNKTILMGRLSRDPELTVTSTGKSVCKFTLAVDRRFKENETDFISIVAWNKTAEFCAKYFTKGLKVAVAGSIQTRSWDDTDGKKHYATDVVADEVEFAESKKNTEATTEKNTEKNAEVTNMDIVETLGDADDDGLPF